MEKYDDLVSQVLLILREYKYCEKLIHTYKRCYETLGNYLKENSYAYSPPIGHEWLRDVAGNQFGHSTIEFWKCAISKLDEIYTQGSVSYQPINYTFNLLSENNQNIVRDYYTSIQSAYNPHASAQYRSHAIRILYFIQSHEMSLCDSISYNHFISYYFRKTEKKKYLKQREDRMTSRFLYYLYSRQLCSYGITIILHYLKDDEDMFWLMISEDAIHKMESVSHESKFDRQFIPDVVKEICSELKHLKYVKSAVSAYRRAIELLYLFLDMKDIEYSSEAMWIWFECVRPHFSKEGRSERRALQILYMKLNGIEVHYERLFRYMPRKIDLLPDWCHNTVTDFLKMKEAEGLKYNTVAMYRSAIFRFCMYLESMGVHSFNEITAVQIKSFNLNDKHKTSESKNAYNVRIRKFLKHLCLEGVISNTHLYFAVPCCSTSRETVVITLTEEEKAELRNRHKIIRSFIRSDKIVPIAKPITFLQVD